MSPASPPAAEASALKTYWRLLAYLKPHTLTFLLSILGFALYAASNPMLAKLNGLIINAVQHQDAAARLTLPLMAIGIFILRGLGTFIGTYFNARVSYTVVNTVREAVFRHLTCLPVRYFNEHSEGVILQRVSGSTALMTAALTDSLKVMLREGLTVLCLLGYVFYLNWRLSLTFLLVAPFMLWLVRYTSLRFRKVTRKNEGTNAALMQIIHEMVSGQQVMRVFNAQAQEQERYRQGLAASFAHLMKVSRINALATPVMQLLVAAALGGLIFLILDPAVLATHSAADLIEYITAVALLPKSMKQLGGLGVAVQRGITGAQLIFELLDLAPEVDNGAHEVARVKGEIRFEHVSFRYQADRPAVLNDISLHIPPGAMVALVGKSGSGKTTLSTLLPRFYDVSAGRITLDGTDLRDYTLDSLRRQIGLVSQNVVLFNDTVRANIAYGCHATNEAAVVEAARKAHALDFIEQLPQGFDTVIGGNGLQLSGGQRQRLAIARAFLKDAPVLILDEATSALDTESEQHIQQALSDVMKGRTTLVIAHRLSTIEKADVILVMHNGAIVEQGAHSQLMQQRGTYYRLHTSKEF